MPRRSKHGKLSAQTYLNTINTQLNAISNHASHFYGLKDSPTATVKKMGSSKGGEMQFWTRDEYVAFSRR